MNEITYRVEIPDMKALNRHFRRVSPTVRRMRLLLLLMFVVFSLLSTMRHESDSMGESVILFVVMLAIYVIAGFAIVAAINWLAERWACRQGDRHGVLGEHTITLTPDALHERTAVNDTKAAWRGIFRIDATKGHLFIFTQPEMAHVIPRRAFATSAEAEAFLAAARQYHTAAQPGA